MNDTKNLRERIFSVTFQAKTLFIYKKDLQV